MNRRNLIKSVLAVATCAVVPFKIANNCNDIFYKRLSNAGIQGADAGKRAAELMKMLNKNFSSEPWQGFIIKHD